MSGLVDPLNEGVAGLLAVGVSAGKEAIDNRRSQPVDGRRVCVPTDESVDSCSGICRGGFVSV
jgi:hypothetical protein